MPVAYIPSWRLFTTPVVLSSHYQLSNVTGDSLTVGIIFVDSKGGPFPNPQDYIQVYNATPVWDSGVLQFSIVGFNTVDVHMYPHSHPSSLHFTESVAEANVINDSGWALIIYSQSGNLSISSIEEIMELARTNAELGDADFPSLIVSGTIVEVEPTPGVWSVPVNGGIPF